MGPGIFEATAIPVFPGAASLVAVFVTRQYCAEPIEPAAKIRRYRRRDAAGVEIENKASRGLFSA